MKKVSRKRASIDRQLRKAERELDRDERNLRCFFFPSRYKSEYHHIIPKSQAPHLIAAKENLLPVSRDVHNVLTFGTREEKEWLPRWSEYLERVKQLDTQYFYKITNHVM
jgi:hypothetical protein